MAEEPGIAPSAGGQDAAKLCQSLLSDLSEWFGNDTANRAYSEAARTLPGFVAIQGHTQLGLILLTRPKPDAFEIHLLAVRRAIHRQGIGTALIKQAESHAAHHDARFLTVKTLALSCNHGPYLKTHRFYRALGFRNVMEYQEPGWSDPALLMEKAIGSL